jgi:hypothetical protein
VTPLLTNAPRTAATSVLLSSLAASTGVILPSATFLSMVDSSSRVSPAATLSANGTCLPDVLSEANAFLVVLHLSLTSAPGHPARMYRHSPSILSRSLSNSTLTWSSTMAWMTAQPASKNAPAPRKGHLSRTPNVVAQRMSLLFYQPHQRAPLPAALVSTALASTARAAALPPPKPLPRL